MRNYFLFFVCLLFSINTINAYDVTGKLVNNEGNAVSDLNLKLYSGSKIFTSVSKPDGTFSFLAVTNNINVAIPPGFSVSDNFPNPFDHQTNVRVNMAKAGSISYDIYNLSGSKVVNDFKIHLNEGNNIVNLNLNGMVDGQYFLKVNFGNNLFITRKLFLKRGSNDFSTDGFVEQAVLRSADDNMSTSEYDKIDSLVVTGGIIGKRLYVGIESPLTDNLDLGSINVSKEIVINEEDVSKDITPFEIIDVEVPGFDSTDMSARFFDKNGYSMVVHSLEWISSYCFVSAPAYVDKTTGSAKSGTVSMQMMLNLGKLSLVSNEVTGLVIGELPALKFPAGTIAKNLYGYLDRMLEGEISRLEKFDAYSGNVVNTLQLRSNLEKSRIQYGSLKNKIILAMSGGGNAEIVGEFSGTSIMLNEENLRILDSWLLAMINGIVGEDENTDEETSVSRKKLVGIAGFKNVMKINASSDGALGLSYLVKEDDEGLRAYQEMSQNVLPSASKEIARVSKYFSYLSLAIGTGLVLTVGSIPIGVVALLAVPPIIFTAVTLTMDASVLSSKYDDKEAAGRLLDNFNGFLFNVSTGFISPTIGAMNEKAGICFDILSTFYDDIEAPVKNFISQSYEFVLEKIEPRKFVGIFGGTTTEDSNSATIVYDINATVTISISGTGSVNDPFGGKFVVSGVITPTATPKPGWAISVTGGPFSFEDYVYGVQSDIFGSIFGMIVFSGGTINGNVMTGKMSFDIGCYWGCSEPIVREMILVTN